MPRHGHRVAHRADVVGKPTRLGARRVQLEPRRIGDRPRRGSARARDDDRDERCGAAALQNPLGELCAFMRLWN
jgi:hypothetical protein